MTYEDALTFLSAVPERTGLFSDFDGTLSPIVQRPEMARALPGATETLRRLAGRLGLVGIISGRPAAFLLERLGPEIASAGVEIYGIHGVEHVVASSVEVSGAARVWEAIVAGVRRAAEAAAVPGLHVEDKRYSVTLHWRDAADPSAVAAGAEPLAARLGAESGLLTRPGKASVELVAPIDIDKGRVVAERVGTGGLARVAFFGDDTSDLSAFAAIDELRSSGAATGLKIAVAGPEAPGALLERADLVLGSPSEALELLRDLADRLEEAAAHR